MMKLLCKILLPPLLAFFVLVGGGSPVEIEPADLARAEKLAALDLEISSLEPGDMVLVHGVPYVVVNYEPAQGSAPRKVSAKPAVIVRGKSAEVIVLSSSLFLASGIRIARRDNMQDQVDFILEYLDDLHSAPSRPPIPLGTKAA